MMAVTLARRVRYYYRRIRHVLCLPGEGEVLVIQARRVHSKRPDATIYLYPDGTAVVHRCTWSTTELRRRWEEAIWWLAEQMARVPTRWRLECRVEGWGA